MSKKGLVLFLVVFVCFYTSFTFGFIRKAQDSFSSQTELENLVRQCREEIQNERADDAVALGEKAVALAPTNAEAHFQLAMAYDLKLQQSSGMGRLSPAKKYKSALEKTVEFDPSHLRARMLLFNYLLGAPAIAGGGVEKAKVQAEEIAKLDEKSGYRVRAAVYQREEEWDLAEKELKAYQSLDPKDPNAAASLANFYRSRKNLEGAESIWTAFLEIQPGNADALLALGGIQAEMSKFEEAKASFQAGLSSGGDVMRFRYQLGRLSALSGMDAEEGIEHLKAYLQTSPAPGSPTWADALWRLGNIYEKTGNKDAAVQAYQKALELNPDHKNAKDSLKALEKK